jgi:NADH:ubiquinone oxidoreductase subunit 6 (subunit J)
VDWLNQQNMDLVAFALLAATTLGSAAGVVLLRNLFHCTLLLAACLVSVGGIFLLLGGELLFAVQLLIYAGAVVVLILYVIMLTEGIRRQEGYLTLVEYALAVFVAGGTFVGLAWVAFSAGFPEAAQPPVESGQATAALADSLLTHYVVPFEVISVLLLVAMIGAIVIAKPEPAEQGEEGD